jgi:streptogramin lyase
MRRIAVLAGLTAMLLSLPADATAAATPDWFTMPTGFQVSNFGVAVDGTGDVWFGTAGPNHTPSGGSSPSQPTPSIARLDPSAAHPGTSDGMTAYPTPDPPAQSCCANQLRSLTYNKADGRVYYVRSDGGYGTFAPAAVQPGTTTGIAAGGLPYPVDLWDVAPSKNGGVWFTESSTTNVAPYWGDRIAYYNGSVSEGPNIAMQNGQTSLNSLRYDAKPEGIAVDAAGRPWFAEADAGNPGYRIGTYAGTGDTYLEYLISPCEASAPCSGSYTGEGITDVAVAQDGKVWFTNYLNRKIGYFDPQTQSFTQFTTASIDPYLTGGSPRMIAAAPDGTLWITNFRSFGSGNALIRVVPGSDANHPPTATYTPLGQNEAPLGLTTSSGDVWFTDGNGKLGRLAGVIGDGVAPPGGGGGGTDTGGGGAGTGGTGGGGSLPAPAATTPASVRPPAVLRPASIGTAHADPPQTGNGEINTNQICVGPPEARCSLVYLVQSHEYVRGFPSRAGAAKRRKHRPQVLATKSLVLHGGESKKVTIQLNRLGQRILRKLGRIKVDFVTSERQADGRTKVVSTKVLTIRAKRKHR